jgi:LysM repeat protein
MFYPRAVTVTSERQRLESVDLRRPRDAAVPLPPAAFATQRLCPYLSVEGEAWRRSSPSRDHRCAAVTPAAPLATDKQRRLCLSDRHTGCATFLAASSRLGASGPVDDGEATATRLARARSRTTPGGETVTRWSLGRTAPVVLDRGRLPAAVGALTGQSHAGQLVLAMLLVAAFGAIALARLSGSESPLTAGGPAPSLSVPAAAGAGQASAPPVTPSGAVEAAAATPKASPGPPSATAGPPVVGTGTYRVKHGDTLYGIARHFGTSVRALQQLNGLGTSTTIHGGDILKLP